MDVFAETAMPVDSPAGEALLATRGFLAGVSAAQLEASQLNREAERRAALPAQSQEALSASAAARGRKLHNPDEPLQRPTTPGGSLGAGRAPDSTQEEQPSAEEAAAALKERTAPAVRPDYPSLDAPAFVEKQATFESRARLPRTPQQKNRELQPLAPASTRSERQRR